MDSGDHAGLAVIIVLPSTPPLLAAPLVALDSPHFPGLHGGPDFQCSLFWSFGDPSPKSGRQGIYLGAPVSYPAKPDV
jgi:hypothetical protein